MKIALVGPAHPYKGGSAQHTTTLAHRLAAAGHEVSLQSWGAQYPRRLYPGELTVDQPEVELFPATERRLDWYRPDGWWRAGRRLGRRYDALVLSVFTSIQVPPYVVMTLAAHTRRRTVVALCHNVLPHERSGVDRFLMRALLRRADAVMVHSAQEAALAATLTSAPVEIAALPPHIPGRADEHPAAPDPDPADPQAPATGPQAAPGGRAPGEPAPRRRLLFFGMVRRYKGLDLLLRALAQVTPPVSLTVAGEIWDGRDELTALVSELGLQDRVTLSGGYIPSDQVPATFAAADALVLPYRSGTASQNALVAMEYGLPVIATRAGAIADAVTDGANGLLCEPGDVAGLARAITLLYEPGTLEHLRAGVRPVDPEAPWGVYVAALEKAASHGRS